VNDHLTSAHYCTPQPTIGPPYVDPCSIPLGSQPPWTPMYTPVQEALITSAPSNTAWKPPQATVWRPPAANEPAPLANESWKPPEQNVWKPPLQKEDEEEKKRKKRKREVSGSPRS